MQEPSKVPTRKLPKEKPPFASTGFIRDAMTGEESGYRVGSPMEVMYFKVRDIEGNQLFFDGPSAYDMFSGNTTARSVRQAWEERRNAFTDHHA